jgi:hypothetical protein
VGTIDSKKLNAALAKAKNIGLVEEACTIGGCDLVFRSLRSEDYTAVLQDCDGAPEDEYIARYQKGHVSRSIVEINGVDLRDSKFVTVEEPDPTGTMRSVTLELPQYLTKHMLDTWGKESLDIAFKKLGDVLELAERQAKVGINFNPEEETPEEKYRRLILEARAIEKDLPGSLLDKILEDQGLVRQSTAEEIKRAMSRTDQMVREQAQAPVAAPPVEEPKVVPAEPPAAAPVAAPAASRPPRPVDPHATLQNAIATRKAMEVPVVKSEQAEPKPTRAAMIAALEGSSQQTPDFSSAVSLQADPSEVVEIKRAPMDLQAASPIVDSPPIAGINPRFKSQQKA